MQDEELSIQTSLLLLLSIPLQFCRSGRSNCSIDWWQVWCKEVPSGQTRKVTAGQDDAYLHQTYSINKHAGNIKPAERQGDRTDSDGWKHNLSKNILYLCEIISATKKKNEDRFVSGPVDWHLFLTVCYENICLRLFFLWFYSDFVFIFHYWYWV